MADGKHQPRKYALELVKDDRVIPVEETGTGREGEHPNIVIREMHARDRAPRARLERISPNKPSQA